MLLISSWAPPMIGGPQSLYRIFSQFPPDSFSILTSSSIIQDAQQSQVSGEWLPCTYYFFDSKETVHGETKAKLQVKFNLAGLKKSGRRIKAWPIIGRLYDGLGAMYLLISAVHQAIAIIKRDGKNLVIGFSDSGHSLITSYLAGLLTHTPYALYLFDLYYGSNLRPPYRQIAKLLEPILIKHAALVIVTNEATADHYRRRYGSGFKLAIIHNSVFTETYAKYRTPYRAQPPYRVVFTGNVYFEQEQGILNLIKATELLSDMPIEWQLYIPKPTANIRQAVANRPRIQLLSADQSAMPKIQSEASLLFLPLAWQTNAPDIVATATPGKFTDYLASGRPMLVHAPDYAFVSQYTKEHKLGLVVDTNSPELLAISIRGFLKHPEVGREFVTNSLNIFHKFFDAEKNVKKLEELLNMV